MNLAFEHPLRLAIALVLLVMVPIGFVACAALSKRRRWVAVVVRCLLMAALVLTLAGLTRIRPTQRLAVVMVADLSSSVLRGGATGPDAALASWDAARGVVDRLSPALGDEDLLGLVVFDGRATPLRIPAASRVSLTGAAPSETEGSRIDRALRLAASMIPPDANGRIVLVSDGLETEVGVPPSSLGVPIDVVPIRFTLASEVTVETLDTPPRAAAESTVPVRVKLRSTGQAEGVLRVFRDGTPVGARRVSLGAGESLERFDVPLSEGRVHRFRAVWEPDVLDAGAGSVLSGDTIAENNAAESVTLSPGAGRVLIVRRLGTSEDPLVDSPLAEVLTRAGIPVEVIASDRAPDDAASFQAFDAVVLEDVPADELEPSVQVALAEFVREVGGGLVMIGGHHSFGAGGWRDTPIEPLLPVKLELPDRIVTPDTATMFVLDNSGSMRRFVMGSTRTQQRVANDAAAIAAGLLSGADELGIVVFNSEAEILVPLARNTDVESVRQDIRRIGSGGGTNIVAGIELAKRELMRSKAKVRHIVVLSDGKSMNAERLPGLADSCKAAGIKVSAIAVGDDADVLGLAEIAKRGGGAYHFVFNPDMLPKVFVKTVKLVRSPLVREVPFAPLVAQPSPLWTFGTPPDLGGLSLTSLKTDSFASTVLVSPEGEPVLATGRSGLGGVLAFTSDASEWSRLWHTWDGFRPFWTNAVRSVLRVSEGEGAQVEMTARESRIRVRITLPDGAAVPDGSVVARLYSPSGDVVEAKAELIDPDTFEATFAAGEAGPYVAVIRPGERAAPVSAALTLAGTSEFAQLTSDLVRLETIARVSGGRVLGGADLTVATLFDRTGMEPHRSLVPWWPAMLIWLPCVFLLDVACRRVAWDRWFAKAEVPVDGTPAPLAARILAADREEEEAVGVSGGGGGGAAAPSLVLDEKDAASLREAARDRRRAERLRNAPAKANEPVADVPAEGLLAAKRRAKEMFDDDAKS